MIFSQITVSFQQIIYLKNNNNIILYYLHLMLCFMNLPLDIRCRVEVDTSSTLINTSLC